LKIKASAPGKLILLGEYAVLKGAPALVMAVNRFAEVILQPISSNHCLVDAPEIKISDFPFAITDDQKISFPASISKGTKEKLSFFAAAFEYACQIKEQRFSELPDLKIKLDTSQFFNKEDDQKLGLGSSAALTAALISGLMQFNNDKFELQLQIHQIFEAALRAHRKAQGNMGSGIDIAASVFGGILKYKIVDREFDKPPFYEKLTIPPNLHILILWTGRSASTGQFVQKVETFKKTEPKNFEKIINRMSEISDSGIKAFKERDTPRFMKTVRQYSKEMKNLGEKSEIPIVSETHQIISEIVIDGGGVYKPSGAGGGDLGVAFCVSAMV
jgi:phosphomevalonate kinase